MTRYTKLSWPDRRQPPNAPLTHRGIDQIVGEMGFTVSTDDLTNMIAFRLGRAGYLPPSLRQNHPQRVGTGTVYEISFAYPHEKIAVDIDHGNTLKSSRLRGQGWLILHVSGAASPKHHRIELDTITTVLGALRDHRRLNT